MAMSEKVRVRLEPAVRKDLEALCRQSIVPAGKVRRARILLLADEAHQDGRRPDWQIMEIVGCGERTVRRVRHQFVQEGLQPTLERKPRSTPGTTPKFDGESEAKLIALCCSEPPEGRQRWTMQLLADELCRLKVVTSVSAETVRQCLKKIVSSRGKHDDSVFPNGTVPASWPTWRRSSMSTGRITTRSIR